MSSGLLDQNTCNRLVTLRGDLIKPVFAMKALGIWKTSLSIGSKAVGGRLGGLIKYGRVVFARPASDLLQAGRMTTDIGRTWVDLNTVLSKDTEGFYYLCDHREDYPKIIACLNVKASESNRAALHIY